MISADSQTHKAQKREKVIVSDGLDIANEIAIFLLGRFQSSFAGLSCLAARTPALGAHPGERVNRLLWLVNRVTHRNRPRNGTNESQKKTKKVLQKN